MSLMISAIQGSHFSKTKNQNAVGGVTTERLLALRATSLLDPPHKALGGDHPGYAVASVRQMQRRIVANSDSLSLERSGSIRELYMANGRPSRLRAWAAADSGSRRSVTGVPAPLRDSMKLTVACRWASRERLRRTPA